MSVSVSWLESLRDLTPDQMMGVLGELSLEEAEALIHDWEAWARPEQLEPPGNWDTWLIRAGRGFGKTRAGVQQVIKVAKKNPGWRIALVARTSSDVRDTMIEGESGILACSPRSFMPRYEPSKRRLTWPNGAQATTFSAEEPKALRGPQHHFAWADELAFWKYPEETWDNLQFGLRLGDDPRVIVTTTPRPIPLLKLLLADTGTHVTHGSTYDNAANLAAKQLEKYRRRYEGTRLGRQELHGELLDDTPGALWNRALIEKYRVASAPPLKRIVVGVDPAVTNEEESSETGIVGVGQAYGKDGHFYVLHDRSCHESPDTWATRVVTLYDDIDADRVVGEVNNGGDLVELTIRTKRKTISFKAVRASRGKAVRAEPIAALYEQGKVHHVGCFPEMEDQMVTFLPEGNAKSPDRVDALVWGLTDLSGGPELGTFGKAKLPPTPRTW